MLLCSVVRLNVSLLSLMFRVCSVERQSMHVEPISLLDLDAPSYPSTSRPHIFADQLKDLISFDEEPVSLGMGKSIKQGNEKNDVLKKVE